jgi:hypothetical protein
MGALVPSSVLSLVAGASALAFSGSRSVVPPVLAPVLAVVSPRAFVAVGCAAGVDAAVRSSVVGCTVYSARSFSASSWVGRLVLRSAAVVSAVAPRVGSLVVVLPSSACPVGLVPSASSSACFRGLGSGSWATAAFAVGLSATLNSGASVLVFSPLGVPSSWGFVALGSGWFVVASVPSLF